MADVRSLMLWLLLMMGGATAFSINYQKEFGDDWTQAAAFVKEHHEEWRQEFDIFGVDCRVAEAIVFPELIRYSMWQDEIERAAVNGLYVTRGSQGADFSIGRFQMKPSFAEQVEQAWNRSSLSKQFGFVFNLQPNNQARRSRIHRLSTMQGQCRYLAIFILLQRQRHPQLSRLSLKDQVRFLATAYNRSFTATYAQIRRMQHHRHYHTDVVKTRSTRLYCYADIAYYYFSIASAG